MLKIVLSICLRILAVGILTHSLAVFAETEPKNYRLLILDSQAGNPYDEIRQALFETLTAAGYVEGQNLQTTFRVADNDVQVGERILREEIKRQHYDVIFVGGTVATIAAKHALYGNMKQPVIFGAPTDPVGIGVIKDFTTPPIANFTGICYPVPPKARLKFLKKLLPHAKTFGLIYADMPQSRSYNQWLQELLNSDPEFAGLTIIFKAVPLITGERGDIKMAESTIGMIKSLNAQVDAFIKPNDQMGTRKPFAEVLYQTATKPFIGIVKDDVMGHWGATAVVYPSHASIGKQAALMIKALFEGKPVADILPEWPKQYGFALDLPKVKQFGMTVPVELLLLVGDNIIK